jgi:hypothetical protein
LNEFQRLKKQIMTTVFEKGQKVLTPDGGGIIEDIQGDAIIVKLDNGQLKTYGLDQLSDDSDAG